ncbi:hypothetical protein K2173_012172 [Erythroxylum novogranatense]|uniref:Uncharacterized protein n=1 Tax=Erythroxylum novogranatense TaxID=1862640 RepID=A0AAV8SRD6_9ROSI|nr:hypothetical protein K2173_012172 [Erythroxylum novogranatense]
MVVTELEMIYHGELVESPSQSEQQPKANPLSSLGRQSSIYSLTLDEFQHSLNESGKNFRSMTMVEFLTSIWNAEENQAATAAATNNNVGQVNNVGNQALNGVGPVDHQGILKQPSLPRQGSLMLPPPLCRKTVDEVCWDMHGEQRHGHRNGGNNMQNPEMTLEDFLIKAGVVKEQFGVPTVPTQQQFGMFQGGNNNSGNTTVAMEFASRPMIRMSVGVDGGAAMGMVGPMSPVSSDGLVAAIVDNVGNQYGMDMGGLRGQKKSATRFRARKQVWQTLERLYAQTSMVRVLQLKHQLSTMQKDTLQKPKKIRSRSTTRIRGLEARFGLKTGQKRMFLQVTRSCPLNGQPCPFNGYIRVSGYQTLRKYPLNGHACPSNGHG